MKVSPLSFNWWLRQRGKSSYDKHDDIQEQYVRKMLAILRFIPLLEDSVGDERSGPTFVRDIKSDDEAKLLYFFKGIPDPQGEDQNTSNATSQAAATSSQEKTKSTNATSQAAATTSNKGKTKSKTKHTVDSIKALLKSKNLKCSGKKDELIKRCKENGISLDDAGDQDTDNGGATKSEQDGISAQKTDFKGMSTKDLKELCMANGIACGGNRAKGDLIEKLRKKGVLSADPAAAGTKNATEGATTKVNEQRCSKDSIYMVLCTSESLAAAPKELYTLFCGGDAATNNTNAYPPRKSDSRAPENEKKAGTTGSVGDASGDLTAMPSESAAAEGATGQQTQQDTVAPASGPTLDGTLQPAQTNSGSDESAAAGQETHQEKATPSKPTLDDSLQRTPTDTGSGTDKTTPSSGPTPDDTLKPNPTNSGTDAAAGKLTTTGSSNAEDGGDKLATMNLSPCRHEWLRIKRCDPNKVLGPLYEQLFNWQQLKRDRDGELVIGFGHAHLENKQAGTIVNGPIWEVLMDAVYDGDDNGAIVLYPRVQSGVRMNTAVVAALMVGGNQQTKDPTLVEDLYQFFASQEVSDLILGNPDSYFQLLDELVKRMSSNGEAQKSTSLHGFTPNKMIFNPAWCLYTCEKTKSSHSIDAAQLADMLAQGKSLPKAFMAITHTSSALAAAKPVKNDDNGNKESTNSSSSSVPPPGNTNMQGAKPNDPKISDFVLPLPASGAQEVIMRKIFIDGYPVVLVCGPPGTGKTYTIVLAILASLSKGQRILVTSRTKNALREIRERLPQAFHCLCVDASSLEDGGSQLQKSLESLDDLLSRVKASPTQYYQDVKNHQEELQALQKKLSDIDEKIKKDSIDKRSFLSSSAGKDLRSSLMETERWIATAATTWTEETLSSVIKCLEELCKQEKEVDLTITYDCEEMPCEDFVHLLAATAGQWTLTGLKSLEALLKKLLGVAFSPTDVERTKLGDKTLDCNNTDECGRVAKAFFFKQKISKCHDEYGAELLSFGCKEADIYLPVGSYKKDRVINPAFIERLKEAQRLANKVSDVKKDHDGLKAVGGLKLESQRRDVIGRTKELQLKLAFSHAIVRLYERMTDENRSNLTAFASLARDSNIVSDMKAYRERFKACIPFLPCTMISSEDVSKYLPTDCSFDLGIMDEASQSRCNSLTGLVRCQRSLIVGDGQQTKPEPIELTVEKRTSLAAMAPDIPYSMKQLLVMPNSSIFDLFQVAFPHARFTLSEHFRCAPELIAFCNNQFYGGNLVALRLPASNNKIAPSMVDIRIPTDKKRSGFRTEGDLVVALLLDLVGDKSIEENRRSIGIICLGGTELVEYIYKRLREQVSPSKLEDHNIMVGTSATFQGAERDIMLHCLSQGRRSKLVIEPDDPEQRKRVNVAMSRAKDCNILVRSIDAHHFRAGNIGSALIGSFMGVCSSEKRRKNRKADVAPDAPRAFLRSKLSVQLAEVLRGRGFTVSCVDTIWKHGFAVEGSNGGDARVAFCFDNVGEEADEWETMISRQRVIERVGWKCFRVDGLEMLMNYPSTMQGIMAFLEENGVSLTNKNTEQQANNTNSPTDIRDVLTAASESFKDAIIRTNHETGFQIIPEQQRKPPPATTTARMTIQAEVSDVTMEDDAPSLQQSLGGDKKRPPSPDSDSVSPEAAASAAIKRPRTD